MRNLADLIRYAVRLALEEGLSKADVSKIVWEEFSEEDKRRKRERRAA